MFFSTNSQPNNDTKIWLCGSYVRLSKEDEDTGIGVKDESNSIANQKALIRDYMDSHPEFVLVREYADDGYSGVTFDRPQFQEMMEDVKNKKINCIIVKDLSRFGRNYIEVGKYLEQVFPFLGIRFIAITDGRSRQTPNSLSFHLKIYLTTLTAVISVLKFAPSLRSSGKTDSTWAILPAMAI